MKYPSQKVFEITDLIKVIGNYKHYFEEIDNINIFKKDLCNLNILHRKYMINYVNKIIVNKKKKNKLKLKIKCLLYKIENILDNYLKKNEEKYEILINNLYNVIFMDINNFIDPPPDYIIEAHRYIEYGPLLFIFAYKTTPNLINYLNEYNLRKKQN